MKSRWRIPALLACNAGWLAIGVAALELVFGDWRHPGKINRLNFLKNCSLQYDVSNLYGDPDPVIRYTRDRYGLRGRFSQPGEIDILTVGGSTTDQRMIRDGETWQDVLQDRFRQAGAPRIVANAGVDGQSTYGHIQNFHHWFPHVPGLKPRYILFYVGLNDFYKGEGYRFDRLLLEDPGGFSLQREIRDKSAIWNLVRIARGTYAAMVVHQIGHRAVDFGKLAWTTEALQSDYDFMDSRLEAYADRLRTLADLRRDFGAIPIFVSQPSRRCRMGPRGIEGTAEVETYDSHAYNGVDYHHMKKRLDRVTQQVAKEKDLLFVDLASGAGFEDDDFYDFAHMTPRGARKIGSLLFEKLKPVVTEDGAASD